MILLVCILAGTIGAALCYEIWPERATAGPLNLVLGMIGGALGWAASTSLTVLDPSVSTFLAFLVIGSLCGAMLSMGLASLRNILRRHL